MVKMSNFMAPTRKIGSNDEFREAVWVDNYFKDEASRAERYGVRFRGEVEFHHGNNHEIEEVLAQ